MSEEMNTPKLCEHLITIIEQGLDLLSHLDEETYASPSPELKLSSIGEHYRHHLDYVAAFSRGLKDGEIDYDDRRRDQQIATKLEVAAEKTRELIAWLEDVNTEKMPREVIVRQLTCDNGDRRPSIHSTIDRELAFLISHAMHHYAIMGLAARIKGKSHPENLGVMPSTLKYERGYQMASSAAE